MKYDLKNNKYFRWGVTAFLTIAASICFYYLLFHGSSIKTGFHTIIGILMPVVFGLVTAYLLTPVLNFIETKLLFPLCRKMKVKESRKRNSIVRGIGILITAFLFVTLIYSLVAMMLSQIVPSIVNIASNFDTYISNFTKWISKLMDDNPELGSQITFLIDKYSVELENWLNNTVLTKTSQVIMTVSLSVINILKSLWDFIIGFVISIYVLASKEKFAGQAKKMAYAFFEQKTANRLIKSFRFTHSTFIGFIGGKIVDSFIIGCLCFIGTTLLQTPYAALVSVIVGVQQFDGNFLGPKILGNSTGLTGFWVIFAITVFGGLFGILGMIVGVPIFAVIYAAIKAVVNTFLRKKDLPVETEQYSYLKNIDEEGFHTLNSRLQKDHELKDQTDFSQDKKDQEEKNVGEK